MIIMNEKILLIDDENTLTEGINLFLEMRDISSISAKSVSEAKMLLDREEITLICTDWDLGDGTGLDILQYAINKNIPIVFLTGHEENAYIDKAMSMGAAKYYIKGQIGFDDLVDDFISILKEHRA